MEVKYEWDREDYEPALRAKLRRGLYYLEDKYIDRLYDHKNCHYDGGLHDISQDTIEYPVLGEWELPFPEREKYFDDRGINNVFFDNTDEGYPTDPDWYPLPLSLSLCDLREEDELNKWRESLKVNTVTREGTEVIPRTDTPEQDQEPKKRRRQKRLRLGIGEDNLLIQLHRRLGHTPATKIKDAYKRKLWFDTHVTYQMIKDLPMPLCPDCMRGRMKAFDRGETSDRMRRKLEKIQIDYKGPFKTKGKGGFNGFYLITDSATDYFFVVLVKSKNWIIYALERFWEEVVNLAVLETQERPVKIIQADVSREIMSRDVETWTSKKGIEIQLSSPYKKHENGGVERDMQTLLDKSRTVMAAYDVPLSFWPFAVDYSVYVINRTPTSKKEKKYMSPHEQVFDETPDITNIVPFFCPGLYKVFNEEREAQGNKSWVEKAKPCRMLGFSLMSKRAYKVWDIDAEKVVDRREDVVWDDNLVEEYVTTTNQLVKERVTPNKGDDGPFNVEDVGEEEGMKSKKILCL